MLKALSFSGPTPKPLSTTPIPAEPSLPSQPSPVRAPSDEPVLVSVPPPKVSRRKSPVRSDPHNTLARVNVSPVPTHRSLTLLYKHKELLKKDIMKKRLLLEKDYSMDLQVSR
jgi:hypothetical protein